MKSIIVGWLVMSLVVVGRSTTATEDLSGSSCYMKCRGECLIGMVQCAVCLAQCAVQSSSIQMNQMDNHYFCNLGCSTSLCSKFINIQNPDEKQARGCINSCSKKCSNTMN